VSGPIRALAEAFWSGAVPVGQLWKPTGQTEELATGVVFLHTFANVTLLRTGAGLVLIGRPTPRAPRSTRHGRQTRPRS
jgi:hypothetical protein